MKEHLFTKMKLLIFVAWNLINDVKIFFTLLDLIKCASSARGKMHIITHLNQRLMYGCL